MSRTVLWVSAHPDDQSLNAALRADGLRHLRAQGHEVVESDLYAMNWRAAADGQDFLDHVEGDRVRYGPMSEAAYRAGTLAPEIRAEQQKVSSADILIVQFPLWWYSCPAILKGWFDRVFTKGFAYGVADPTDPGRTLRYGQGPFEGKRAMLVVTAGGREAALGPRGVHGDINDLLFPLHHGTLWYTGMSVLPPVVHYGANRVDPAGFEQMSRNLRERLDTLDTGEPIPFRFQNGGDYDDDLVVLDDIQPGVSGLTLHLRDG